MNVPFLILLMLGSFGLGIAIAKHGEPRPKYDGWATLIAFIIEFLLILWALNWSIA